MSAPKIVARAGGLGLTAENVRTLARHIGLPEGTPVSEVAAEINGTPIAASQASRIAKRGRDIETELRAAVADGRIPESGRSRWRSILASRGEAGMAELRSLASVPAILAKAKPAPVKASQPTPDVEPEMSLLAPRPFSLVANVDEAAAAKRAAAKPVVASASESGVVADPGSGALSWQGLPVSVGSDGSPLVHTVNGAMTPAAFTAAGLDPETERVAVGLARLTGSASKNGLPARSPLFGGS